MEVEMTTKAVVDVMLMKADAQTK